MKKWRATMKQIYLDNNATTRVKPEVIDEMSKVMHEYIGNPSSIHEEGQKAAEILSLARCRVSKIINSTPEEIIFTSGGTESDNLAIKGYVNANLKKGNHIITSKIEHPAVIETCNYLSKNGFDISYIGTDKNGIVDLVELEETITDKTLLISIMHANNEVGTVQPIHEIVRIAKRHNIAVHTDAVQSVGKIPVDVESLGVDLLSLSSHKINGPKGVGALFVKKGIRIEPMIHGGHQQKKKRPGTENLSGIAGFGKAAELVENTLENYKLLQSLRDEFENLVLKEIDHVSINGKEGRRVPNTSNISFHFIEGESVALSLSRNGISVSTGSACASGSLEPSHVLASMKVPIEYAQGAIRFSFSSDNKIFDIAFVVETLKKIVSRIRDMSPLYEDLINEEKARRGNGQHL
jgi:cysteine desulfurase